VQEFNHITELDAQLVAAGRLVRVQDLGPPVSLQLRHIIGREDTLQSSDAQKKARQGQETDLCLTEGAAPPAVEVSGLREQSNQVALLERQLARRLRRVVE
jgi:hypothetical protein